MSSETTFPPVSVTLKHKTAPRDWWSEPCWGHAPVPLWYAVCVAPRGSGSLWSFNTVSLSPSPWPHSVFLTQPYSTSLSFPSVPQAGSDSQVALCRRSPVGAFKQNHPEIPGHITPLVPIKCHLCSRLKCKRSGFKEWEKTEASPGAFCCHDIIQYMC